MLYKIIFTILWMAFILIFSNMCLRSGMKYQRTGTWGTIKPPGSVQGMDKEIARYFIWIGVICPILVLVLLAAITWL